MVDAALLRARVEIQNIEESSRQLDDFGRRIGTTGDRARDAQGRFVGLNRGLDESGQAAGRASTNWRGLLGPLERVSPVALTGAGALTGLGIAAGQSARASIEWESALAGVSKTLDTTGLSASQAQAAVNEIGADLRTMATRDIPIAVTELASVAEVAGQLGVAREDVVDFTETMAKLGTTTDLTSEQAATSIARIANITGLATDEVDNFGSSLVDLGNNSAATESEILAMATRIAAAGDLAGLTEGEILGLAAALTSVGINAEAGGTAIVQVMNEITTSVESMDERLESFASIAGQSAAEFANTWRSEPNEALTAFIEGLGRVESQGGSTVLVLDELGLDGIRVSQALRSAAGAGDLMREAMDRGNTAFIENNALNREAAQRYETTASRLQLARNRIHDVAISLGDEMTPALADAAEGLATFVEGLERAVAGPEFTRVVDQWESDFDRFGELPQRFPDPPEEKKDAWLSFASDMAGVDWDDVWSGLFPDEDRFAAFADTSLPEVSDEQISRLEEIIRLYENTPSRVRTVTQAEYDHAQQLLELIEIYQLYEGATDDQRQGLEQLIDRVLTLTGILGGSNDVTQDAASRRRFLEENTWDWAEAEDGVVDAMVASRDAVREATLEGHRHNQMIEDSTGAYNSGIIAAAEYAAVVFDLSSSLSGLEGAFRSAGAAGEIFNRQGSEYSGIASDLEAAYDAINEKIDQNQELTEAEQAFLERYPELYARLEGAQSDATIQAGLWAEAQAAVILAQDAVNAGLDDAPAKLADAARSIQEASDASGIMTDAQRDLLESILDVQVGLDGLNGQEANIAVNLLEGAGSTADARGGPTRFEQRAEDLGISGRVRNIGSSLTDLDGSTAEVTATVDETDAVDDLTWIEDTKNRLAGSAFTITAYVDTSHVDSAVQYIDDSLPHSPARRGPLSREPDWDFLFAGMPGSAGRATDASLDIVGGAARGRAPVIPPDVLFGDLDVLRSYLEDGWEAAVSAVQSTFTGSGGIASIMTGDAQSNLQEDIATLKAYMDALLEAGFSRESDEFKRVQAVYDGLMQELAVLSAIAGTEAAQAFYDQWIAENEDKQWVYPEWFEPPSNIFTNPTPNQVITDAGRIDGDAYGDGFYAGVTENDPITRWIEGEVGSPFDVEGGLGIDDAFSGIFSDDGESPGLKVRDALDDLIEVSEEGLARIEEIFEEFPEAATSLIDDLAAAVTGGALTLDQALGIIAQIPRNELIPALERLEEQLRVDLVEAMLEFGEGSPQVQAILQALEVIEAAAEEAGAAANDAAKAFEGLATAGNNYGNVGKGGSYTDTAGPAPVGDFGGGATTAQGNGTFAAARGSDGIVSALAATAANASSIDVSDWISDHLARGDAVRVTAADADNIARFYGGGELSEVTGLLGQGPGHAWIGGGSFSASIPSFADGGTASGWSIVGEDGPELTYLPPGTNVYPHDTSMQMMSGLGGMSRDDMDYLANAIAQKLARAGQPVNLVSPLDGRVLERHVINIMNGEGVRTL